MATRQFKLKYVQATTSIFKVPTVVEGTVKAKCKLKTKFRSQKLLFVKM